MIQYLMWAIYAICGLSLLAFETQVIVSAQRHSLIENKLWRRVAVSATATLITGTQALNGLDWSLIQAIAAKAEVVTVGSMLIAGLLFPNANRVIVLCRFPMPIFAITFCFSLNVLTTAAALLPTI